MTGTSEEVTARMKKNVLSWFGHVEGMRDERMSRKIYDAKVSGKKSRGRPCLAFENTVRRLMTVDEAVEVCRDHGVWRSIPSDYPARDTA